MYNMYIYMYMCIHVPEYPLCGHECMYIICMHVSTCTYTYIYIHTCDIGMHVLLSLQCMDVRSSLRHVCFHTTNRSLRDFLVSRMPSAYDTHGPFPCTCTFSTYILIMQITSLPIFSRLLSCTCFPFSHSLFLSPSLPSFFLTSSLLSLPILPPSPLSFPLLPSPSLRLMSSSPASG